MPARSAVAAPDWSWLAAWPDCYYTPGQDLNDGLPKGMYAVRYDLAIVVYGRPAPQGSKRHVGKGVMIESSEHLKPWREAVRSEAAAESNRQIPGGFAFAGPVAARMVFTMSAPKSARPGDRPAVEPDLDKLVRGTCDALADAGVIANDKLIVEFDRVAKVYPCWDPESLGRPGAVIRLRRLT
jgi:crossover junction endodeoxyribonuclease RusA